MNVDRQDDFREVVRKVRYEVMVRKEPMALEAGNVYFFLERGAVFRRECNRKSDLSIKPKERTIFSTSGRMQKQPNESKEPPKATIREYESYEVSANLSKYLQDLFYAQTSKNSTVLYISWSQLEPAIFSRIKEINVRKLRLIYEGEEMRNIQRMALHERLHKFQYLQLQFGQILYSSTLRSQFVFFIKSGLIEVISGKKSSGFLLNARRSMGWQKDNEQWVRCVSERVECYIIKIQALIQYFPALCQNFNQLDKRNRVFQELTAVQTPRSHGMQTPPQYIPVTIERRGQGNIRIKSGRRRNVHKSMENLKGVQKQSKRLALKQHFSNYYNEIFDQFSEKKMRQMGNTCENQENLYLYKIQTRQRKPPAMEELKKRLKRIRIQKINACKQRLQKKAHMYSLSGLGVTILEEQL